jgi:hypothetical protein
MKAAAGSRRSKQRPVSTVNIMPDAISSNKAGGESSSSSNVGSGEDRLPPAAAQAAVGGDINSNINDDNQDGDDML